ncbi:MAG: twin-arginine translocation signal domain-containing protein [Steroidobacteraceae bacterium]
MNKTDDLREAESGWLSRRSFLKSVPGVVGAAAGLSVQFESATARAQVKLPQSVAKYQDMPKNGQECSTCVQFQPPDACKLVVSPIGLHGWCMFYAKKG